MAKNKNKKRNIAKRIRRAGENRKVKRKLTLAKLKKDQQRSASSEKASLSAEPPPDGFRTISTNQAILEYARPLMEKAEGEENIKGAMQAAMVFWNYSIAAKEGNIGTMLADMEKKILKALRDSFHMDEASGKDFLEMMVARYDYLFPRDIQPREAPFMFIRKDVAYLIRPVDASRIQLNQDVVVADDEDRMLFQELQWLDELAVMNADFENIDALLSSLKDRFPAAFQKWLIAKGLAKEFAIEFSTCLSIWFDFIYAYEHDEDTSLVSVPASSWFEFFHEFLLRKTVVKPPLYVHWPPALKLFYQYLHERNFVKSAHEAVRFIQDIEPGFYDLLRKQFS
ncbi:MAG: hypothetical protein RBT11_17070 [Desulfobacterales bacterium]|jgi:hypothetical protein|nr:hypothetical protein [Desulfobacterales bacterium]